MQAFTHHQPYMSTIKVKVYGVQSKRTPQINRMDQKEGKFQGANWLGYYWNFRFRGQIAWERKGSVTKVNTTSLVSVFYWNAV